MNNTSATHKIVTDANGVTRVVMSPEVEARRKAVTKASAAKLLKLRQEAWDRLNAK